MRLLGIDSSGLVASVALIERRVQEEVTLAEYSTNNRLNHSVTLLPMLEEIMKMTGMKMADVDAIAVAGGPGSFTGLRIGVSTAKGLGMVSQKPLIKVPTLEGLAYNLWGSSALICPIMDARRGQVYTGIYRFSEGGMEVVQGQMAVSLYELGDRLKAYKERVTFLGDGVPVFRETLEKEIFRGRSVDFAPSHLNRQRASSVAARGLVYYDRGETISPEAFVPDYLRISQAEREKRGTS